MERLLSLCNPFAPNMERLFSPCNRYQDILHIQASRDIYRSSYFRELNLDVSTEALLSAESGFTYADLYAMLCNRTIAWLTPHAAVFGENERAHSWFSYHQDYNSFRVIVNGKEIHAFTLSVAAFSETFDVVSRLLLADVREVYELNFKYSHGERAEILFNAATLATLMKQCQNLKSLKLENVALDEDHFRALGEFSKPGLEIELKHCRVTGAAAVLAEVLASNQGPTKLDCCYMDYSVIANGLRQNSRLKSLKWYINHGNQEALAIAGALKENKGLVELLIYIADFVGMSNETWFAFCDSLKTHPTLEVLDLGLESGPPWPPAQVMLRIQALVDMLKVNMTIHTIPVIEFYCEDEPQRTSVIPYLETNRLRPRLRAIQKAYPLSYRAKVLGQALIATRTDANSLWMLLSGNVEVAFSFSSTAASTSPAFSIAGAWRLCCW
jgi:hypothetical protein